MGERLERIKKNITKHKEICIILSFILFLLIVWLIPELYVNINYSFDYSKDKAYAIQSVRTTIGGGILALVGIYLTWRRTSALDKQNETNEKKNAQEWEINNKNYILQQFAKASELLANVDNLAARLSGIFLFEKIMNENEEYHWQVIELLTAYVRDKRDLRKFFVSKVEKDDFREMETIANGTIEFYKIASDYQNYGYDDEKVEYSKYIKLPIEEDIQTILTILGRRNKKFEIDTHTNKDLETLIHSFYELLNNKSYENLLEIGEQIQRIRKINLSNVNLYGANLKGTNLQNVDFSESHLIKSDCSKADLSFSNFSYAHFEYGFAKNVKIIGSMLSQTHLEIFRAANSDFSYSYIFSSYFQNALISKSKFINSILSSNIFRKTKLNSVDFENSLLSDNLFHSIDIKTINFENAIIEFCNFISKNIIPYRTFINCKVLFENEGISEEIINELLKINPNITNRFEPESIPNIFNIE